MAVSLYALRNGVLSSLIAVQVTDENDFAFTFVVNGTPHTQLLSALTLSLSHGVLWPH